MSEIDELFARLRDSVFAAPAAGDPNQIPQQGSIGDGNVQPTGFYSEHSFSSFVGQTNLLFDPVMASIRGWTFATAFTTAYQWLSSSAGPAWYEGKINTTSYGAWGQVGAGIDREVLAGSGPFNSDAYQLEFSCTTGAGQTIELDFAAFRVPFDAGMPQLNYLVGSLRLACLSAGVDWVGWTSMTAYLDIVDTYLDTVLYSESYNLKTLFPVAPTYIAAGQLQLVVAGLGPFATGAAHAPYLRLRLVGVASSNTPTPFQLWVGEPSLHFNYIPGPLPYTPLLGQWLPESVSSVKQAGTASLITSHIKGNTTGMAYKLTANGRHQWASASAAGALDLALARTAAKELTVDDANSGAAIFRVIGSRVAVPKSTQTVVAGTAIVADYEVVQINCTGNVTMTAAPTIADGADGQMLTLINVDTADTITLQDQGTLASSNLRLTATTVVLARRQSIQLMYSAAVGDWVQIGNLVTVI